MSSIRKQMFVQVDPVVGFNETLLMRELSVRAVEALRDWERAAGGGHYPAVAEPNFIDRIELYIDIHRAPTNADAIARLIDECVKATRQRFPDEPVTPETVSFMDGFVRARGWDTDITDVLLAALTRRESDAVSV